MNQTPSPHPELDQSAIELFRLVSRMEYALKATGFLMREEGSAEPNWDRFARDVGQTLLSHDEGKLKWAIRYLLDNPPKKQMVRNGEMFWEDNLGSDDPKANLLFKHIRQVRNNLFHGGKFNGKWFEPQRSAELMDASLTVLQTAVELNTDVYAAFSH